MACLARYTSGRVRVRALKAASLLDAQNAEGLFSGVFLLQRFVRAEGNTRFVVRVAGNLVETDVLALPVEESASSERDSRANGGGGGGGGGGARQQAELGSVAQGLRSTVAAIVDHVLEAHGVRVASGSFEFVYAPAKGRAPGPDNAVLCVRGARCVFL
jgi:hypothetical protein